MNPTQILSDEHRVIEVVLNCLEELSGQALQFHRLDKEAAEQILDLIRNFADKCHHGKEENHLFARLTAKGMPAEGGPVGQMLAEHKQGREFVAAMTENLESAAEGDNDALRRFVDAARGYVQLLRAHIQKEDVVLFPLAERILNEMEKQELLDSFNHVEAREMGSGTHERYLALARALAEKFGVAMTDIPTTGCGCAH